MSTSASISELQREKDTFQDVLPNIIDTLKNNSKFSEVPEVADWTKKVQSTTCRQLSYFIYSALIFIIINKKSML